MLHQRHEALDTALVAAANLDTGIGSVLLFRLEQDAANVQVWLLELVGLVYYEAEQIH